MKIAILGWGSLIWDEGDLHLENGMQKGGPMFPIEFSRISNSRKRALTLVIDPINGVEVPTQFAKSKRTDIADAICDLHTREGTSVWRIGYLNLVDGTLRSNVYPDVIHIIRKWAIVKNFMAVIWTDLPSNFEEEINKEFSVDNALDYLIDLEEDGTKEAIKYFSKAPQDVKTPLRKAVEGSNWFKDNVKSIDLTSPNLTTDKRNL